VHFVFGGRGFAAYFKGTDITEDVLARDSYNVDGWLTDRIASHRANCSASFRSGLLKDVLPFFFFFVASAASFRLYFAALALLVAARICWTGNEEVGRTVARILVLLSAETQYLGVAIVVVDERRCCMRFDELYKAGVTARVIGRRRESVVQNDHLEKY